MRPHHVIDDLPFYLNQTLPFEQASRIALHLERCSECRTALDEWRLVAQAIRTSAEGRTIELPVLSWTARVYIARPRSLAQGMQTIAGLIWGQRPLIMRGGMLISVTMSILIGVLATLSLSTRSGALVTFPLLVLVPFIAVVAITSVNDIENDPAFEIVSAAPTSAATLIFARLTFALLLIGFLALVGSLSVSLYGLSSLSGLVWAWLGPMACLSALTTILTLFWGPRPAMGSGLTIWAIVITLLMKEIQGRPMLGISLQKLLYPDWEWLAGMVIVASLLWVTAWLWLGHTDLAINQLERR